METQTCICVPDEDGIDVFSPTHWIDFNQAAIAGCLNIAESKVNMVVRRLGGSYGGKVTRASQIACATALACHLTNRPIRFVMSLESNMRSIGKRPPIYSKYEVDIEPNGTIKTLHNNFVQDCGCSLNDVPTLFFNTFFGNCYDSTLWINNGQNKLTEAPSHTFCRGPGSMHAIAATEFIMEHIAWKLNLDPVSVRMANLPANSPIREMLKVFLNDVSMYFFLLC